VSDEVRVGGGAHAAVHVSLAVDGHGWVHARHRAAGGDRGEQVNPGVAVEDPVFAGPGVDRDRGDVLAG